MREWMGLKSKVNEGVSEGELWGRVRERGREWQGGDRRQRPDPSSVVTDHLQSARPVPLAIKVFNVSDGDGIVEFMYLESHQRFYRRHYSCPD